jgi:hypothetical protein
MQSSGLLSREVQVQVLPGEPVFWTRMEDGGWPITHGLSAILNPQSSIFVSNAGSSNRRTSPFEGDCAGANPAPAASLRFQLRLGKPAFALNERKVFRPVVK